MLYRLLGLKGLSDAFETLKVAWRGFKVEIEGVRGVGSNFKFSKYSQIFFTPLTLYPTPLYP
jgi:hypothetical protein